MTPARAAPALLALAALLVGARAARSPDAGEIEPRLLHLGNDKVERWADVSTAPQGTELSVQFSADPQGVDRALQLVQEDVDDPWTIELNGRAIGALGRGKERATRHYLVPSDALRAGDNRLRIAPAKVGDDVVLGRIRLLPGSFREALQLGRVRVSVRDGSTRAPLPARVTFVPVDGPPSQLYYVEDAIPAPRPGLAYTADGELACEIPAGRYAVHATRGSEWSLASAEIEVAAGGEVAARLALERELDTRGVIACDTHVHTYTFSGHGDASVDERLASLAAEGVELAVATDHNHHTDYAPRQAELGLSRWYRSVVGNEVTTKNGHFNAFPLDPAGAVPPYEEQDWATLVAGIRAAGARVVILNHPRWPKPFEDAPFHVFGLDQATGAIEADQRFTFDAMELVNATDRKEDALLLFSDWFALLNRGERIAAVGSSDSHTLIDPVGQGRTYVPSASDDPAEIDVGAACAAIRAGRTTFGLGIYCQVRLANGAGPGDVVDPAGGDLALSLVVQAPSWIRPRIAQVFQNGREVVRKDLEPVAGRRTSERIEFRVPARAHDSWIVCVVRGDPVDHPAWPCQQPYTLAGTNPIWIDGDGDGTYSSPRAQAEALVQRCGGDAAKVAAALASLDDAVGIQVLALADVLFRFLSNRDEILAPLLEAARARPALRDYWQRTHGHR